MDLIIINASPRGNGNSGLIAGAFAEGAALAGGRSECYCLADRARWADAQTAIGRGEHVLFVLPAFFESPPGIMLEFLEELALRLRSADPIETREMSFIVHGGFPEACQRRCCERYLKKIPDMMDSRFAGILSRGDTFFMVNVLPEQAAGLLDAFRDMGRQFVEHGGNFFFPEAEAFTGSEYFTPQELRYYVRMSGVFLERLAMEKGCQGTLMDFPYDS